MRFSPFLFLFPVVLFGQSGTLSSGGDVSNSSGSVSFSTGQTFYSNYTDNSGTSITEGLQQTFDDRQLVVLDSVSAEDANQGIYRAYWSDLPSGSTRWKLQWRKKGTQSWREKSATNINLRNTRINIHDAYDTSSEARLGALVGGNWIYSETREWYTPCRIMTATTNEVVEPFCNGDSALVRVRYTGGYGPKTILWSNGADTKFTYAQAGEKLLVTITDAVGCSVTDSVTGSVKAFNTSPSQLTVTKSSPSTYQLAWNAPNFEAQQSLIYYRMYYRLRGTQSWTVEPLVLTNSGTIEFSGTGNVNGNYEFTVAARYSDAGTPRTSEFACRVAKGYTGNSSKTDGNSSLNTDITESISVYPNPTNDLLYVSSQKGSEVQLLDAQGKIIYSQIAGDSEMIIDLSNKAQGVYMLRIFNNEDSYTERVIKN